MIMMATLFGAECAASWPEARHGPMKAGAHAQRPLRTRAGSGFAPCEATFFAAQVITMTGKREWVITASAERPLEAVAADLAAAGLEVQHVLTDMGIVAGAADEAVVAALRSVPGVLEVSPGGVLEIGPPDTDVS